MSAVITIGLDPYVHLGPVTLAWHGLTTALGVLVGAWVAVRLTEQFKLSTEPLTTIALIAVIGGLLDGRLLYLAENTASASR